MTGAADATAAALTRHPGSERSTTTRSAISRRPGPTRDQTVFAPLNDYTATVVGMVRDDVPFNTLLSADIIYIADARRAVVPAYSTSNNACTRLWTTTVSTSRCT